MLVYHFVAVPIINFILISNLCFSHNIQATEMNKSTALESYQIALNYFDNFEYEKCLKEIDTALTLINKNHNKVLYKNLIELRTKASTKCLLNLSASNDFDLKRVKVLIQKGANLNEQDEIGNTPLIWASFYGRLNFVKLFIQKGAKVNKFKNIEGLTPQLAALQNGKLNVFRYLIKKGAKINLNSEEGVKGLIFACTHGYLDIVKELIRKGVDINTSLDDGKTPLMFGAEFHQPKIIEYLIKKGADFNLLDTNSNNALQLVFSTPRFLTFSEFSDVMRTIELLIDAGINIYNLNNQNNSPEEECIKWQENYIQYSWKIEAISKNFFSKSEVLIKNTNNELFEAIRMNDLNSIKNLIEKEGFNVNYNQNGLTPLLIASFFDYYEIASFLIEKGANITFIPKNNKYSAVLYSTLNKNYEILKLLLANIKDVNELTINELINIIKVLIREENLIVLNLLVKKISEHSDKLLILNESLTLSVLNNNINLVNYFIQSGASPNCSINGKPIIFEAIKRNNLKLLKLLYDVGANLNIQDYYGNTPLITAVYEKNFEIVKFLINARADIDIKNYNNKTALEIAVKLKYDEIINLIKNNH